MWNWFAFSLALIILDLIIGANFALLCFGVASGGVGLLLAMKLPISWPWQVSLFAILSLLSFGLWYIVINKHRKPPEANDLNMGYQKHIGHIYTVITPIKDGEGKVRIGSSPWRVIGPDLPKGAKVKVISVHESTFVVKEA